jgi:hypothetical protein
VDSNHCQKALRAYPLATWVRRHRALQTQLACHAARTNEKHFDYAETLVAASGFVKLPN